jgi:hypothetical protein
MFVWLKIETWVIGKGGTKSGVALKVGCWAFWLLYVFGCISVAALEGPCVRNCRELGLCMVGTVG